MNEQIDVIAHIQAKPGEEAFVRSVLESYVAPTRLEEGCLRYDLFSDVSDPAKFTLRTMRKRIDAVGDLTAGMWRRKVSLVSRFEALGLEAPKQ